MTLRWVNSGRQKPGPALDVDAIPGDADPKEPKFARGFAMVIDRLWLVHAGRHWIYCPGRPLRPDGQRRRGCLCGGGHGGRDGHANDRGAVNSELRRRCGKKCHNGGDDWARKVDGCDTGAGESDVSGGRLEGIDRRWRTRERDGAHGWREADGGSRGASGSDDGRVGGDEGDKERSIYHATVSEPC